MTAWLIAALTAIGAAVAAWLKGRSRGRADAQAKQDADYKATRERIDHVPDTDDLDDDTVVDRLRDHAGKR